LVKLNIGCGPNFFPFDGWINYDKEDFTTYAEWLRNADPSWTPGNQKNLVNYIQGGGAIDFRKQDLRAGFPQHADGSVDAIYLGQMIEHINPMCEAPKFIGECRRMLRPGGVLRIATPDLELLINAYNNGEMGRFSSEQPEFYTSMDAGSQLAYLMFGSAGEKCTWDNYEGHMFLYSRKSMETCLSNAGFQPPFFFYSEQGQSTDMALAKEVFDAGMTHSFIAEAVR